MEWYCNTVNDLLLLNTVNKKDEKLHTAGLDDTAIPHINIKITEIPLVPINNISLFFSDATVDIREF